MLAIRRLTARHFPSSRPASSLVTKFDTSVDSLPLREAVWYKHVDSTQQERKFTAKDFKWLANAHANALLEFNITKGDNIMLWLPECHEKHAVMIAAAKAGVKIVDADLEISDISDVRQLLKASECKIIYFKAEHGDHEYLTLLRRAIPEFFDWDPSYGQLFRSKHFPKLRYFFHTGRQREPGCYNFNTILLPDTPEDMIGAAAKRITDEDPLYQYIKKGKNGGIEVGPVHTGANVLDLPQWSFAKKIINKEFFQV